MDPLEELRALIDAHGWAVQHVVGREPAECFSYTVGLTGQLHPEIVVTGLTHDVAHVFLNNAGHMVVREHGHFAPGEPATGLTDGPPFAVLPVSDTSGLTAVASLYGDVRAVQLVWTDSRGRLPWDPAHGNPPGSQPLLGPR